MYKRFLLVGTYWDNANKNFILIQTIRPLDGILIPSLDLTIALQAL